MGLRISDMTALSELSKNDMFEVTQYSSKQTYSVSAQDIATFVKNVSNGGFKGISDHSSLDDFTIEDVGVWWWSGTTDSTINLSRGMVEIVAYQSETDAGSNSNAMFLQRISYGNSVFQRMWEKSEFYGWADLTNRNGCIIEYGYSTSASVTFSKDSNNNSVFTRMPSVIITPAYSATDKIYSYALASVSATGFSVNAFYSETSATETKSETHTTTTKDETTSVTTSDETTSATTYRGAWTQADEYSFYWIAVADSGTGTSS